ncbi:MAG TPA: D-2-hydroxyacid dehydrogenase [Longimicrobiales bacterium]|nr:D-2-hydroxyacid dehydrogenase [Longimicrobiales bacterium]
MRRLVLDLADRRPVWSMPDWVEPELAAALPEGWEVVRIAEPTDGAGDGAGPLRAEVLEAVAGAEIYLGYGVPPELLEAGKKLRWVHTAAAGVARSLSRAMLASEVVFTNSAGVHGPPIAETVLGMLLFFFRGLDLAVAEPARSRWHQEPWLRADTPVRELAGSTVGIVGYGGIGREVARRVASLGARVIALARRERTASPLGPLAGGGDLSDVVRVVRGAEGLDELLGASDAVVITVPETPETRGLIDERALARAKPGAVLVNVARGSIVDEDALARALSEGRLRGAGLDVFAKEPLPERHPFYTLPNVLVTPHVSGVTAGFWRREMDLILRNLARYLRGAPLEEWENVVDKRAGY